MISVITATYNRSNSLAYAVRSVLRSTYDEWELIVVGDACTDDSEEVISSFADSRIRFVNLSENFGDQSGPNNVGFDLANGEYIAYLNHDDLFFPDHLQTSLSLLESTGADFAHSSALRCHPVGPRNEKMTMRLTLHAVSNSDQYTPLASVPASTWLVRRQLVEKTGPWKAATQTYGSSSQDWLFRAWRGKNKMLFKPRPTVLLIPSGIRRNDYKTREIRDIAYFYDAMVVPGFRENHLEEIAVRAAAQEIIARYSPIHHLRTFSGFCYRLLARLLIRFGVGPRDLLRFLTFGRKGNFIQHLRKRRGLPPLSATKQKSAVFILESTKKIVQTRLSQNEK